MSRDHVKQDMATFTAAWQSGNDHIVSACLRARCHDQRAPGNVPQVQPTAPGVCKVRTQAASRDTVRRLSRSQL
jgi:hypothetical protein